MAEDKADKINFDEICPICGKKKDEDPKNPCNKKADLNLCPAEDTQCHNNAEKTIDGENKIIRKGCTGKNNGSQGVGTVLGKNILSGSTWAPGVNAKATAGAKLFKKQKDKHYLYTNEGSIEAHHLICSAAMDDRWIKICEMTGYNINCRLNGVFLPADILLACHTGLQRHKGNHNLGYAGGMCYVEMVKMGLKTIISSFRRNKNKKPCTKDTTDQTVNKLNSFSKNILTHVAMFSWTIAWDSLNYNKNIPMGLIGCANSQKGEIDEKKEYLQKKMKAELERRGLDFTKVTSFDDMEKLKKVKEEIIKPAKCKLNRNHSNKFPQIQPIGYILTIGH